MSLVFQAAAPSTPAATQRADVACFIGHVARRAGRPLLPALREQLDAAGWLRGIWARKEVDVEALLNLPLVVDSWHVFDRFYAWDERPVSPDGSGRAATQLGAAVRAFFARGGRRAVIVRVGDPWSCLEGTAERRAQRAQRLDALLPAPSATPAAEPSTWRGIAHLHGLPDVSLLLLPDLVDLCADMPPVQAIAPPRVVEPRGFAPCDPEPLRPDDSVARGVAPPRLDNAGQAAWLAAVARATSFLATPRQRRAVLVTSLPLASPDAHQSSPRFVDPDAPLAASSSAATHRTVVAQLDPLAYLLTSGVLQPEPQDRVVGSTPAALEGPDDDGRRPPAAFVQFAWPWLRSGLSGDLPGGVEAPEGTLAGLIAATAVQHGTFRSAAGERSLPWLRDLAGAEPDPAHSLGQARASALARRVCLIAPGPAGWELRSDVSAARDPAWRQGGACRLIGAILRQAQALGDGLSFEPSSPRLWQQLRRSVEELLEGYWRAGALGRATPDQAYSVRCDRSTMSQADLDAGRLVVEIGVRPAAAIEQITVVLNLVAAGAAATGSGAVRAAA